jgi:arsenical pump membrane protein
VERFAVLSTFAMTMGLVVARPRLGAERRLSPALAGFAGIALLVVLGLVGLDQLGRVLVTGWRSFVAIACIMVMTEAVCEVGLIDWLAARIEVRARSAGELFGLVFALSATTAAVLNNDAAILLLTPVVVAAAARRGIAGERALPFAYAVFAAAGVAPLVMSNPINTLVADLAGISFLAYAARMVPVAAFGCLLGYVILRRRFAAALDAPLRPSRAVLAPSTRAQRAVAALLAVVLVGYTVMGWLGGPVWLVALGGAAVSVALVRRGGGRRPGRAPLRLVAEGVSWDTLGFLFSIMALSSALLEVGVVDLLVTRYDGAGLGEIGVTSALGSALINNHPMAYLNVLALEGAGDAPVLAALVGGDLGPRLLPTGSLAGLLWLEALRRQGVDFRLGEFVKLGLIAGVPVLLASLAVLAALT